ncbi:hypothetical protein HPP92_012657 [Vanilla planifolia]|uniref:Uncharacterized protein n=1 Tax=Vanilla planifolia TaxID=51239 RepID=A0A835UY09_VANPL|nr:hypothetical protein HPP92_012657 [Vanilla planifolia]
MTTSMKQLKNWITYPFQAFKRWRRTKSYEEQCNSSVGFSVQERGGRASVQRRAKLPTATKPPPPQTHKVEACP